MPSFLNQLSIAAEEKRFHNELEHFKNLDFNPNFIIRKKKTHCELAQYLHASCLSPPMSTFVKAIKNNNFTPWPALTPTLLLKNLPKTISTYQGHLHSERKGLPSTQSISDKEKEENDKKDAFPLSGILSTRTNDVCYSMINPQETTTGYMDLTGRFRKRSSRGNEYIYWSVIILMPMILEEYPLRTENDPQ